MAFKNWIRISLGIALLIAVVLLLFRLIFGHPSEFAILGESRIVAVNVNQFHQCVQRAAKVVGAEVAIVEQNHIQLDVGKLDLAPGVSAAVQRRGPDSAEVLLYSRSTAGPVSSQKTIAAANTIAAALVKECA